MPQMVENHIALPVYETPSREPESSTRCKVCRNWLRFSELDNVQQDADFNEHRYCDDCYCYHQLAMCSWCEDICDPDLSVRVTVEGGIHPDYSKDDVSYLHPGKCLVRWVENFEANR